MFGLSARKIVETGSTVASTSAFRGDGHYRSVVGERQLRKPIANSDARMPMIRVHKTNRSCPIGIVAATEFLPWHPVSTRSSWQTPAKNHAPSAAKRDHRLNVSNFRLPNDQMSQIWRRYTACWQA